MPKLKDFELILPSFECNRNCPYCTAKITKWYYTELNLDSFEGTLARLRSKDYHFKYFILCGNGEPSFYEAETLERIFSLVDSYRDIFEEIRVQTSGNLFFEPEKLAILPKDTIIEITRVSFNSSLDMSILGHDKEYLSTDSFKNWDRIRLNLVILKGMTPLNIIEEVNRYSSIYTNIETISIKTLNLNTKNGNIDNKYSKWIMDNAVSRDSCKFIIDGICEILGDAVVEYNDRHVWKCNETEITLYAARGSKYGDTHMVFYGDKLVDFELNAVTL